MPTVDCTPTSRSLGYGLQLLRLFDAEHPVRGISELAELMQVSRPTAHRYATTCLELGYLEAAPLRRYRLAPRSTGIGRTLLASLPLSSAGAPVVRSLRDATGRTACLAVLDGTDVVYLQRLRGFARGEYELERGLGAGSRRSAELTAAGRALLARAQVPLVLAPEGGRCGGIGVAILTTAYRVCALEITLPGAAMQQQRLLDALSRELREAARRLAVALLVRDADA